MKHGPVKHEVDQELRKVRYRGGRRVGLLLDWLGERWYVRWADGSEEWIDRDRLEVVPAEGHNHFRTDGGPEPDGAEHDRMYPDCPATE